MQRIDRYIEKVKASNKFTMKMKQFMPVLSLMVIISVFWSLKLIGITLAGEAFCGKEEHIHDEKCGQPVLICELNETEGHYHTENCLAQQLVCTLEEIEGHTHQEECYNRTLVCTLEEADGHIHTEECKAVTVICTDEMHEHNDECMIEEIICGYVEKEGHHHDETCYTSELVCTLEELEGHSHTEECYAKAEFICEKSETEEHLHTAECVAKLTDLGCGKEVEKPHTHNEDCYGPAEECALEEHIHTPECYSDINADLEMQSQWEETLPGVVEGARPQDNIIAVATSQLGYTESEKNFEVDENGEKNGYNRYGQWYGNPYGQWNTMFVSFCLHYSKLEGIPLSAGAETMRLEWESAGLYIPAQDTLPSAGDLIFLDKNVNGAADAVAIVTAFEEGQIKVIEGDLENKVAETVYSAEDAAVMGFGVIPDMSGIMTLEARASYSVARTVNYTTNLLNNTDKFLLYVQNGNNYYAIDGNGKAVPVYIDDTGNITTDQTNTDSLLWTFEYYSNVDGQRSYRIKNVSRNVYLHPYRDNDRTYGVLHNSNWRTVVYPISENSKVIGVRLRGDGQQQYAQLANNNNEFVIVNNSNNASIFKIGRAPQSRNVWFDGTNGGLRSLGGSDNTRYTAFDGEIFKLPESWKSPTKYHYKLKGWYDVTNGKYYEPGAEISITGDMVFYADWVANTYDVGIYDEHTVNTVSGNGVITTRVFDYGPLFNVMSANASVTVNANSHSETWTTVEGTANVKYNNMQTQNFMFIDQDGGGKLMAPNGRGTGEPSTYQNAVTKGIYSDRLAELLFSTDNCYDPETGLGVVGKTYLGAGDYLFQYGTDPNSEYYGYYYYDSKLNAASYNQSEQRFYVYDYLEATTDTINNNGSLRSDFLPLNSIYANTNGQNVTTYTYNGANGEYQGTTHYRFDSGGDGNGNANDHINTNYSFGMAVDVKFYLPGSPGSIDEDGNYKNCDVYGKEMIFRFSGDDDVWVLVDGKLVMDIGGIHQIEAGEINFATGEVIVDGQRQASITYIEPGEHILTLYYLDRGGSMSNCAMYYSIAPRYSLNIQKEDVLTQDLLNGAEFAVYTDEACTEVAELWKTEEDYLAGRESEKIFTVENGEVDIWGFVAGSTYYIKEVRPPNEENYDLAKGIIRFKVGKSGIATYDVEIIEEKDEEGNPIPVSNGFTVHGVHIDEGQQKAKIVVTNGQNWIEETTTVQVVKIWNDDKSHSDDYVTAYLTVTDPDGTVRRIREIILSEENQWRYLWTGLPNRLEDGTLIEYGMDEAYEEGYYSSSMKVTQIVIDKAEWGEYVGNTLKTGTYLFKTGDKYLSATSATVSTFKLVDEETAKKSSLAQWTVTVDRNNRAKITNGEGQTITYINNSGRKYVVNSSLGNQNLTVERNNSGLFRFKYDDRYMTNVNQNGEAGTSTNINSALTFKAYELVTKEEVINIDKHGFQITNTPLQEETSLTVTKNWELLAGDYASYQQELVTVKLLADGVDTGRTVTLMLKNGWTDTFRGLPYKDEEGNVIVYTVEEVWKKYDWRVTYGEIVTIDGKVPTYRTTVTNTHVPMGPALPSTGSFARLGYIYCGGGIMLASLISGIRLRRRKERRLK